ncbi:CLUMA_CG006784, isoform A [Clunio marinus]|uniref:CLUMA_CG006784, isoform A n=1 Tax=Clunio marinus TaxID=568069 RepID=A0A1J1HYQ8_9DIPT|nr:CLUMA_CG006784, isoform A [Clunio marinus]
MNANIDFIRDINERYCSLEYELDKNLKKIEADESILEANKTSDGRSITNEFDSYPSSLEEARKRNRKILDDLEQARAFLRSRVIYSPLEAILEKAQKNYFLPQNTTRKKKYGPVFV